MLGFVFPGETPAILGGRAGLQGRRDAGGDHRHRGRPVPIVGDSVGYFVGERWGRQLLSLGPLRKRQRGSPPHLDQLRRRGATAVFVVASPPSCAPSYPGCPASPPCPTASSSRPTWPVGCVEPPLRLARLLRRQATSGSRRPPGIASDILLGLGHAHRGHRRPRRPPENPAGRSTSDGGAGADSASGEEAPALSPQSGRSSTERSPARKPARRRGVLAGRVVALGIGVQPTRRRRVRSGPCRRARSGAA